MLIDTSRYDAHQYRGQSLAQAAKLILTSRQGAKSGAPRHTQRSMTSLVQGAR